MAAVDYFLKLEGIDGESGDHKHKDEIEVLSFSWGLSNSSSQSGGGGGAGKVTVGDISFTASVSKASPLLMESCCTGKHIKEGTLTLISKGTQQEFYKIKLTDILVSSYQTGGNTALPVDQFSLNFRGMDLFAQGGKGGTPTQVSCDFIKFQDGQLQHNHDK